MVASALKANAGNVPVPRRPPSVTKVFEQLRKLRGQVSDDEDDLETSEWIWPAPARRGRGAKPLVQDSPETIREIQADISASSRTVAKNKRKQTKQVGKSALYSSASSDSSLSKRRTHRGGSKARERRERKQKKADAALNPKDVDDFVCFHMSRSTGNPTGSVHSVASSDEDSEDTTKARKNKI